MPFKVKDLMIEVSSLAKVCQFGTIRPCGTFTACHFGCSIAISNPCHLFCTQIGSQCTFGSHTWTFTHTTITTTSPIIQPQVDPGVLKEQLKEAISAIEEQEKAVAESLIVKTAADAEMLEGKLGEALEEVKRLRKTLK